MCVKPSTKKNPKFSSSPFQPYLLTYPCGKCPLCIRKRLSNWIFRIEKEQQRSLTSTFITLTYNEDNLPHNNSVNKRDLQLFFKRLRKHLSTQLQGNNFPLRYICVSEYGEQHGRPHYHLIAFNFPDNQTIEKIWGNGFISQTSLTPKRIKYTFKYINKPKQNYLDGQLPNFQLTSKGIGANYLTSNAIEYHNRQIENCYITKPDGNTMSIPKYYKTKLYSEEIIPVISKYQQERINAIQDTQIANLMQKFRIPEKEAQRKFELSNYNTKFDKQSKTKL